MADLRDIFSLRALTLRQRRTLRRATDRAAPLFAAMLEDDPDGLRLAEHPLADLPAAEQLAKASSEDVLAIAVAAQGHLRRIPLNDTFRALSLKPPRAYGVLFASIRILEVSSVAGLPFDLEDTKLLCAISLNAVKVKGAGDATIRHGDEWPDFAAQMIKGRLWPPNGSICSTWRYRRRRSSTAASTTATSLHRSCGWVSDCAVSRARPMRSARCTHESNGSSPSRPACCAQNFADHATQPIIYSRTSPFPMTITPLGRYGKALGVGRRIDPDRVALRYDDVLVNDGIAHHGSTTDRDARKDD